MMALVSWSCPATSMIVSDSGREGIGGSPGDDAAAAAPRPVHMPAPIAAAAAPAPLRNVLRSNMRRSFIAPPPPDHHDIPAVTDPTPPAGPRRRAAAAPRPPTPAHSLPERRAGPPPRRPLPVGWAPP